jgi:hypothetical protein
MSYPVLANGRMVTLRHRFVSGQDDYGNDTYDYTDEEVGPCSIQQANSRETTTFSDQVLTGIIVFMPWGTEVDYEDRMIVDGDEYEITGDPDHWQSPFSGNTAPIRVSGLLAKGASS